MFRVISAASEAVCPKMISVDEMESGGPPDYIVNIRWYLEGLLLLAIGTFGIIGELLSV